MSIQSLKLILLITILGGGVLIYGKYTDWNFYKKPCAQPIYYSVKNFDSRFGISEQQFLNDINKAVSIWESPIGKNLFEYSTSGKLKINLVYDYRQQATEKLNDLGFSIDSSESSYKSLKSIYDSLVAEYNSLKPRLDAEIADYNKKAQSYEQQVNYWNSRGGAPPEVVAQLNRQRDQLSSQASQINSDKERLNKLVEEINALATTLNRLAKDLNLDVSTYNSIGESRGSEFEEGLYKKDFSSEEIDIYEFTDENMLVRVLAHELGHGLGLDHVDDKDAIMYKLNQSKNSKLSAADLLELKQLCGIK